MPAKTVRRKLAGNTRWDWNREDLDKPTDGDYLHGDGVRLTIEAHHESGLLFVEVFKGVENQMESCFSFSFAELGQWLIDPEGDHPVKVEGRNLLLLTDGDDETHRLPKDLVLALAGLEAA